MLLAFDFVGHVTLEPTSASGAIDAQITDWLQKDRKILSVMGASLTEETLPKIIGCKTARSAFLDLDAVFAHSSLSRANQLRAELLALCRDTLSVDEFASKFNHM